MVEAPWYSPPGTVGAAYMAPLPVGSTWVGRNRSRSEQQASGNYQQHEPTSWLFKVRNSPPIFQPNSHINLPTNSPTVENTNFNKCSRLHHIRHPTELTLILTDRQVTPSRTYASYTMRRNTPVAPCAAFHPTIGLQTTDWLKAREPSGIISLMPRLFL